MDPNQYIPNPKSPKQPTPYISDFVGAPRQQSGPQPGQSQSTPALPVNNQPPTSNPQQFAAFPQQTTSSLVNAQPMTSVTPRSQMAQQSQEPANIQPGGHRASFEPPAAPKILPNEDDKPKQSNQGFRDILSIFGVLGSALVLAFCLITFVFQSYQVDGPSMQTSLQDSDHLIVWKVPKTLANLTNRHYIPNRGDVIVFNASSDSGSGEMQLIKRVIARPGERVTVKDNQVTVYNEEFPNGFSPDKTLPYGKAIVNTPGNVDITVKEDEVYVLGDNRGNSRDSRMFGPIKSDQIVGKLVLRVLPLNTITKF